MSSTAASNATSSAPKPVESAAKPAHANTRAPKNNTDGEAMFASLLSLLANTQVLPEATTLTAAAPGEPPTNDTSTPGGIENPLAALLGWGLPGGGTDAAGRSTPTANTAAAVTTATATGSTALPAAVGSPDHGAAGGATHTGEAKIDITGMTAVEPAPLDLTPKGQVALPANAVRLGAPWMPTRAAENHSNANTATTTTAATAAAPWRQATMVSTETGALQSANHNTNLRSTVALNERFGLTPGAPLASTELREASTEGIGLGAGVGAGSRTAEAVLSPTGTTAGDATLGSDNTGSDNRAFDQTDSQSNNPFADANATEEPTVTHWGTQHLRHASLRVGGEGDAQAIDIQLSMQGQEVQVVFNTDSAEARASLRDNAGESLADLLNKSGIQLGGVSVGSQGQSGSRGDGGAAGPNGVRGVATGAQTMAPIALRPAQTSPRADGSQPLDVFV